VRDAFETLTEKKVTVFGISTDKVGTQKKFVDQNKLSYDLIADTEGDVAKAFGVPLRFGGKFAARSAFLFKDQKLVWKDEKGATATQGEDALKAIKDVEKGVNK
jgi:peroxiredoxin Q/BCP